MLPKYMMLVCSDNCTRRNSTLCGQNLGELFDVKVGMKQPM
jgi:hypothetical protein